MDNAGRRLATTNKQLCHVTILLLWSIALGRVAQSPPHQSCSRKKEQQQQQQEQQYQQRD